MTTTLATSWEAPTVNTTLEASELGTDTDAALRFVRRHGDVLRHVAGVGWLWWNGQRWQTDAESKALHLAMEAARAWTKQWAASRADGREKTLREAISLESAQHIRGAVYLAATLPTVALETSKLDRDPYLLNCMNGTLDLRTGKLCPHSREDYITKLAPVNFDPAARHPVLERYLAAVADSDREMPPFLARCFGVALTGDVSPETLFLLQGDAGSGKTTLTEALAAMLGDYAVKLPFESLCQSKHGRSPGAASPDLIPLRGARFGYATEGDAKSRLDSGKVKELTGGEPITARGLYQAPITFDATWKLWLVSNFDPKTDAEDGGIWRRMAKLHFSAIPEDKRDPAVKRTLLHDPEARAALLTWAVLGCLDWQSREGGRKGLGIPAAVLAQTEAYREKQDTLGEWWSDLLIVATLDPCGWVKSSRLREHYDEWCDNEAASPVGAKRFAAYLESRNLSPKRRGNPPARGWEGIEL